jgi:hypothetical protein
MMKKSPFQNLVILTMITLYVVGSGYVVLYGAQFYTKMVKESEQSLLSHSALLYFNNRIKEHDGQDQITLISDNGITALCFVQDDFYTMVYEFRGYLVEQSSETPEINPMESQKILELSDLTFTFEDHGISISYTDQSGKSIDLRYALITLEAIP